VFLTLTGHRAEEDCVKDDAATTEGKAA
jgi:hypothetical protein